MALHDISWNYFGKRCDLKHISLDSNTRTSDVVKDCVTLLFNHVKTKTPQKTFFIISGGDRDTIMDSVSREVSQHKNLGGFSVYQPLHNLIAICRNYNSEEEFFDDYRAVAWLAEGEDPKGQTKGTITVAVEKYSWEK